MPDAAYMAKTENISGELFDLSVPTLNNEFGWKHITGIMTYGISFPLEKFIDELETILKDGGPQDDKSSKREARLRFLYHCFESKEVQDLFPLFCNYINGGGDYTGETWYSEEYDKNLFIITVAGGNIITLFGQLITNIIDSFTKATNAQYDAPDFEYEQWDMHASWYSPEKFDDGEASDSRDYMFENTFRRWNKTNWDIINETYRLLTDTNKVLIQALEKNQKKTRFSKEQLAFLIASHFLHNDEDEKVENDVRFIARSTYSDFDFKLSPNIDLDLLKDIDYDGQEFINELGEAVRKEQESTDTPFGPPPAGFLLLRAKTLIICNSKGTLPGYTNKQLKSYQSDCARDLGPWVYSLFPQTMQAEYLGRAKKGSNCHKFLTHLMGKKLMIGDATRNNVDEILKFYLSGYYKPVNRQGDLYQVVPSHPNSSEAIVHYLRNTTYNLNVYIEHWETLDEDGEHKLSHHSAPGLHYRNVSLPERWGYRSVCFGFLNLNNILYQNYGLISRLSCDILNYFLNQTPLFHTETILDNLIQSVNNERYKITKKNDCYMPPSDLVLVPTNKNFNPALKQIKYLFDKSRYSELGYPDGIRITINAIQSDTRIPDTRLDNEELRAQQSAEADSELQSEYLPLASKNGGYGRGYRKSKKHKSKKHKSKKHKSKKYKSKKHKKYTKKNYNKRLKKNKTHKK